MSVDTQSLNLVLYPDPILKQRALEVDASDANVQAVAQRMIELMFDYEGVGLAAPQIGLPWRLFVTRDPNLENAGIAWINPSLEIIASEVVIAEEGCLSLPEIRCDVRRPLGIRISGWNEHGKQALQESEEFIARVWQHENDHLDGILLTDKMSAMDRLVNRKVIKNLEKAFLNQ